MRQTRRAAQQARDNLRAELGGNQAPNDSDDGEFVVPVEEETEDFSDDMYDDATEEDSDYEGMDEIIQEGIMDMVEQV